MKGEPDLSTNEVAGVLSCALDVIETQEFSERKGGEFE